MGRPKSAGIGLYEERPDSSRARSVGEMIEAVRNLLQKRLESIEAAIKGSRSGIPDEFQAQELFRLGKAMVTLEKEQGKRLDLVPAAPGEPPRHDPPPVEEMTEEQIQRALRAK